ncbi:unnamed protein product [Peronospora belbahrii]|uniref:C2H2-type domain-containing protein n=1 Tax=Peronospora belbahrii TaxID=622444 RepID=A0AAU9KRF8_9STRA|nr:unnamed protein product [Peronospora belbahrii]CAH0515668.1 unnamed protein product [Peronospora belbahrii]
MENTMPKVDPLPLPNGDNHQYSLNFFLSQENVVVSTDSIGIKKEKNKIFRCTFPGCGREFQLKGNLKRHVNIHKGEKKFACKFCNKCFLRKADMEVHYRVHTGEKPYRCKYNECGKCFARRSDLLSHERTHTGRRPYACTFSACDRRFARKFDLHKHQRLHEDQADTFGKSKTKKRKLSSCQTLASTRNESCDCPSDVATPFIGGATSSNAALTADVLLPGSAATKTPVARTMAAGRRKMSATAACLDTPTRPSRYELKCPENHIDSPPACLAALSSLDAFLLSQESLDISRPFSLDAFPPHCPSTTIGTSCCPAHLELRPPPPEGSLVSTESKMPHGPDMMDQLFTTFPSASSNNALAPRDLQDLEPNMAGEMSFISSSFTHSSQPGLVGNSTGQTVTESSLPFSTPSAKGSTFSPDRLLSLSTVDAASVRKTMASSAQAHSSALPGSPVNFGNVSLTDLNTSSAGAVPAAAPVKFTVEKACFSTPTSSLLDYSRHNRSCGHLSIQHGNHRDYVVQNHLVCQDSVTKLGVKQRSSSSAKAEPKAGASKSVKCTSPKDTHRPGCGHLPVRHNDHIDYVVEDNLICQQASWLEDDNLELLGDDFWDFYGAIDAFPTN